LQPIINQKENERNFDSKQILVVALTNQLIVRGNTCVYCQK